MGSSPISYRGSAPHGPPCSRDNQPQEGWGFVPPWGEVVQTCVGQSQGQGPSQQPLARPVTWAQLFRGEPQGLWRASVGTAVKKGKCVDWAGHRPWRRRQLLEQTGGCRGSEEAARLGAGDQRAWPGAQG